MKLDDKLFIDFTEWVGVNYSRDIITDTTLSMQFALLCDFLYEKCKIDSVRTGKSMLYKDEIVKDMAIPKV